MHTFELNIGEMSKIEGKASLTVKVEDGKISDLKFAISEFKRFYTQAIKGADAMGLPQITARICGTCSNAHLLCTIKAVENAFGIVPSEQTMILRKLLNFGLIIRDHALHLYVFTLPDLLGIDSILDVPETDQVHHQLVHDCFDIKRAGNNLGKVIGGRSVHAPSPTIGSFMMLPDETKFPTLIAELESIRPAVLRLIDVFLQCDFTLLRDVQFAALVDQSFSFLSGSIITSDGTTIPESDFGNHLEHVVIPYSNASGYRLNGKTYMVGALARLNLGKSFLHPRTQQDAKKALDIFPSKNIYHNNLAQAIEILHAIDSSIDLLKQIHPVREMRPPIIKKETQGIGVIEAPRGTLYYKLMFDENGKVKNGDIVVPTGQNQIGIEQSIYEYVKDNLDQGQEKLVGEIEKIVRAYDPCMSCASHFLQVKWI